MSEHLSTIQAIETSTNQVISSVNEPLDLSLALPMAVEFTYSFIIGLAFGWAIKHSFKWIMLIVGIVLAIMFTYQFLSSNGHTNFELETHYQSVAPLISNTFKMFTDFLQTSMTRIIGFWMGMVGGITSGRKNNRRINTWIRL